MWSLSTLGCGTRIWLEHHSPMCPTHNTLAHTSPLFSQKLLFAGSHSQLVQVPLAHCSKYRFCADCILARDPYCAWNVNTSRCVSAGGPSG